MKPVVVRGVLWAQACLLLLGFLAPGAFANPDLFEDYVACPTSTRGVAPSGLTVYRTAQPGQLLVTWDRVDVDAWRPHGDTVRIMVVVSGAAASHMQHTSLRTSRAVFEDVVGPGPWQVSAAVLNRNHLISWIGVREFSVEALELESAWDRVHRFRRLGLREPTRRQVAAAVMAAEPKLVHMGTYDDPERHAQGLFHLVRDETRVTATFSSAGSAVAYAAGPDAAPLFTVPIGFRPRTLVLRDVEGWPVAPGSVTPMDQVPIRFRVRVAPNGDVGYVDEPALAGAERLAYMLAVQWTTTDVMGGYIAGTYGLQRRGHTVHGFLHSTRAALGSEILFTVPEGFRPVEPVLLEIPDVWVVPHTGPLIATGVPEPTLQIRITPEGAVRHTGHGSLTGPDAEDFVAYELAATWQTADPPQPASAGAAGDTAGSDLCSRHLVVQGAVLEALGRGYRAGPACAAVTGAELATVDHLALILGIGHAPLQRRDFAGLSGLTRLSLDAPDLLLRWWPPDLLAEVPALEDLHLYLRHNRPDLPFELDQALMQALPLLSDIEIMPTHEKWGYPHQLPSGLIGNRVRAFLAYTPELRQLSVVGDFHTMPADLLAATPHLRRLTLKGRFWDEYGGWVVPNSWSGIPKGLLAPVPGLTHLTMYGNLENLSPAFLEPVPHLQYLVLLGHSLPPHWPSNDVLSAMLVATPHLQHLSLMGGWWTEPSADLLETVPGLRSLHLVFGVSHPKNPTKMRLPVGFLAPVPRLARLNLYWDVRDVLPRDLLHHTPDLLELTVSDWLHPTEDFLQFVPRLRELRGPVRLTPATVMPPPQVQHMTIYVSGAHWPEELLAQLTQVTALELLFDYCYGAPSPPVLPVLPGQLSRLTSLTIDVDCLEELPVELLAPVPQLTALTLKVNSLEELPVELLAHVPQLTALTLDVNSLEELPVELLAHVPQLTALTLKGDSLEELPVELLAPVPQLTTLTLESDSGPGLPAELLRYTPDLQHLVLEFGAVGHLSGLPAELLRYTPDLQHLVLEHRTLYHVPADLPAELLQYTPHGQALEYVHRGYRARPTGMHPHRVVPFSLLNWWNLSWGAEVEAEDVRPLLDYLLQYPYLDIRTVRTQPNQCDGVTRHVGEGVTLRRICIGDKE